MKSFSLVTTVFNEMARLGATLQDIEQQTLKPAEIVITDAGSTDGTYEALLSWAKRSSLSIKVLKKNKCNVAEGRNLAITQAKNDLIVSTDFGCRYHPRWLESLVKPFDDEKVKVVGGAYNVQESSVQSLAAKANFVLTRGYQIVLDESFIPSSRSIAYYRSVWQAVGGYCEWLTLAADDLVFGKAVKAKGFTIELVREPYVYWGRHEKLKGYGKEAYRYGLGDGEARVNQRNALSLSIEALLRYLFFLFMATALLNIFLQFINPFYFLPCIVFLPGLRPYYFSLKNWLALRSAKYNFKVFLFTFLLIEITRFNYLKGYIKGYFFSSLQIRQRAQALADTLK